MDASPCGTLIDMTNVAAWDAEVDANWPPNFMGQPVVGARDILRAIEEALA